jgi:hypothetical protein
MLSKLMKKEVLIIKKALSEVISTILIILLVLVASGIVWVVYKKCVKEGAEQVSIGKFTVSMQIKQVQINSTHAKVKVVRNSGEGEVTGIKFIFDDGDNTEVITKNTSINQLDEKTYDFIFQSINGSNVKKISIAPILKLESGKEVISNVKDEYKVRKENIQTGITCTDTCSSLGYNCGYRLVCGSNTYCGTCSGGATCNSTGQCTSSCTDTCSSF